jgi:hypothetical protein
MRSTFLCLAALLVAAMFLFSVTDGNLSVHGDDALIFGRASYYLPHAGYLFNVAARVFLTPVYIRIYDALGSDPWRMHVLFLSLHVLNMMLCFLVLRTIFGVRPAMVGALFYLVYTGPYESVTWLSAGGYLMVMTVLFVSVWIALSDWNPWMKGIVIALLSWAAMHLYEVLIVAAPLYPILTAAVWWRRERRIPRREFLPTLLPLGAMSLHWFFMFLGRINYAGHAIWMRNPNQQTDPWSILKALLHTGELGFTTCCGARHWDFLSEQIGGILSWHSFGLLYYVLLALALGALILVWILNPPSARERDSKLLLTLLTSAYLILLSPLVAFTIVDVSFPSRLLVLCAAGLALLAATIVARWPNVFVIGLILCAGAAEGLGLQSILVQEETSNAVDSNIRRQLLSFHLTPQLGDRFFFSLPDFPERRRLWRASFSQFESGGESIFLISEYGFLRVEGAPLGERISLLRRQVRGEGPPELNVPVPAPGDSRRLYPFFLTDDGKLMGISPVDITVGDHILLRRYENPQFASSLQDRTVPGSAAAAWYRDGELRLNYYQPNLQLEITGKVHRAAPGARMEVRDGQRSVVSLPFTGTGDFTGRIPMRLLKPDSVITLNTAGTDWEFQGATFAPPAN